MNSVLNVRNSFREQSVETFLPVFCLLRALHEIRRNFAA